MYSDRKVIILPRYTIPCLPLSNTVVVCYGRVHYRIQSWIPGSVLFRLTDRYKQLHHRNTYYTACAVHGKVSTTGSFTGVAKCLNYVAAQIAAMRDRLVSPLQTHSWLFMLCLTLFTISKVRSVLQFLSRLCQVITVQSSQ